MKPHIQIIGAGLAGCELAYQLANFGAKVTLYEMKLHKRSPAHTSTNFAELVCSNSFRSDSSSSAIGLLHHELHTLGSICLQSAYSSKVPAGDALAVDRESFSLKITSAIKNHPNITIVNTEITDINLLTADKDNTFTVIATGPLTSQSLNTSIATLVGEESLNFFDAIAPIIYKESIDFNHAWWQSRYDKHGDDYINCPLTSEEYDLFYDALIKADCKQVASWDSNIPFFEGCLPIEIMAQRGKQTLLFGSMKPVGLTNPYTNQQSFAVLQLRQDNNDGTLYNIVGFQTRLKYAEQKKVLKMIPALQNAEFAKLGSMHKNTFINSPKILNNNLSLKTNDNIFFAGQITGCEGYCESIAIGLLCALFIIEKILNTKIDLPKISALNALLNHVTNSTNPNFQPSNINFGLFPKLETNKKVPKKLKRENLCNIALANIKLLKEDLIAKKVIVEANK